MLDLKLKFINVTKSELSSKNRKLLESKNLMTPKLEKLYKQEMKIRVIKADFSKRVYQREIIMFGKKDKIPRELAHIKIVIGNLNEKARKEVLESKKPFGKILTDHKISSERKTKNFFKVNKNNYITKYLKSDKDVFYGRKSLIFLAGSKKPLAQVTEIFL